MKIRKENIILGTIILSASSIFVRMIGFVFRIYLSNAMGAEGIGLYSLIMSLYALCSTVATSGISIAVSKLVAEELARGNRANASRVLKRAVSLSLGISVVVSVIILLGADFIAVHILKDPRTVLSLRTMAPGMPFLSVSSSIRGYFIAERHMGNPASSQVIEQVFKMGFIMLLLPHVLPMGLEYGCALVVLGISIGEAICLGYTLLGYWWERKHTPRIGKPTVQGATRRILSIAVPISASSYVRSALRLVEDILILRGFKLFSGQSDIATGTYGVLKGMVMPLLIFPLSLLSAFVTTLTPEISRLGAQDNPRKLEHAIAMVLRYTSYIGIFIVGIFVIFSHELGVVIYKDPQAGAILKQMAFLVPFMCIEMVVVSILQGLGEQVSSMRYNVSDCFLRIALVYCLIPLQGVQGFLIMVVASNLFTSFLNLRRLLKITRIHLQWREWFFQPALATLAAGQVCRVLMQYFFSGHLALWQSLSIGLMLMTALYLIVLVGIGSLRSEDMDWIRKRLHVPSKSQNHLRPSLDID